MIVWINGTYGVGKTSVAQKLCEKHPNFVIVESDECFNDFLTRNTYGAIFGGTLPQNKVEFIEYFRQRIDDNNNDIVVVMALTTDESRTMLYEYFTGLGKEMLHFILEANEAEIFKRIEGDQSNRDKSMAISYLEDNMKYLCEHYNDAIRLNTNNKSIEEIVSLIDEYIGVN